jgi:hypothetical protein
MTDTIPQLKPIVVTFYDLKRALAPLHQYVKADVDRLHDLWKLGAPSPDSRILIPAKYDERLNQKAMGNYEKRIVFPTALATWIQDVSARRGFPYTFQQALAIVLGEERYTP